MLINFSCLAVAVWSLNAAAAAVANSPDFFPVIIKRWRWIERNNLHKEVMTRVGRRNLKITIDITKSNFNINYSTTHIDAWFNSLMVLIMAAMDLPLMTGC